MRQLAQRMSKYQVMTPKIRFVQVLLIRLEDALRVLGHS
jgi:hypothetical protein